MKKITSKQVFTVVLLIGVVACLIVYMQVFTKFNDLTEELKTSNEQLRADVEDMKQYYDQMEVYKADTKDMINAVEKLTADYPGDAKEEDVVMMAVDMQSVATINYDQINIKSPEKIHTISEETVAGAELEGMDGEINFMMRRATYSNTTTYADMKQAVQKVYESPYRIGVDSIAYKKNGDSDNYIEGTITISYYSLRGMGKDYTAPKMPTYFGGASGNDLFGLQHWALTEEDMEDLGLTESGLESPAE